MQSQPKKYFMDKVLRNHLNKNAFSNSIEVINDDSVTDERDNRHNIQVQ